MRGRLAAKLQIPGWDIGRSGIAKIENGSQAIIEYRIFYLMHALRAAYPDLLPPHFDPEALDFHDRLTKLMRAEERKQRIDPFYEI